MRIFLFATATLLFSNLAFSRVAVFVNSKYIDYQKDNNGSEGWNLEMLSKKMLGDTAVETFTGETAAEINTVLEKHSILLIPEQENGSWKIVPEAANAIYSFMSAGGIVVFFADPTNLLNAILPATTTIASCDMTTKTKEADSTPLGVVGPTLSAANATTCLAPATLPSFVVPLYQDPATKGVSALYGQVAYGGFYFLGWDFYDALGQAEEWRTLFAKILASNFRDGKNN